VKIDIYEPKEIEELFKREGFIIERAKLDIGDYQINNFIIERKEIKDFFNSVHNKRIFEQLYQLSQLAKEGYQCFLVIIGDIPKFDYHRKEPISKEKYLYFKRLLLSFKVLCPVSYNIALIHLESNKEFVQFIRYLNNRRILKGGVERPVTIKKKERTIEEIRSDMLVTIPKIGRRIADKLAEKYSIKQLVEMSEEELSNIVIGKRRLGIKAKYIKEALEN